jgi:hypothetical protein
MFNGEEQREGYPSPSPGASTKLGKEVFKFVLHFNRIGLSDGGHVGASLFFAALLMFNGEHMLAAS